MKNQKKIFYLLFLTLVLFLIYCFFVPIVSQAAYPTLVSKLSGAFEKINSYIKVLSTPAAATAIGTGIFIKKFSFGDEERIRLGKKLIRTALFSYAFLICTDLLLSTILLILA